MANTNIYRSAEGEAAIAAYYDRLLARWPVAHTDCYLPTRYGDTFVIACGEPGAPPVILLHGSASNALAWAGEVAELHRAFRVYAVDLPGEPGRSSHQRPPWAGPAFAEWLSDVLDGLGVNAAGLVGISQGGWTALKMAIGHPERAQALVLLTPAGIAPTRPSFVARAVALSMLGKRGASGLNRIVFGDEPIHPEALAFMDVIMTNFKPRIGAEVMFTDEELASLRMPVLLIAGLRDAVRPSDRVAERLQRLVPHAQVLLLPVAGHVLTGQGPAIRSFLEVSLASQQEQRLLGLSPGPGCARPGL